MRILSQQTLPPVAVADLATYTGRTPVYVPGVGAVDRVPGTALWAPVDVVRNYTLVGSVDFANVTPADPNNVVTADLPANFAINPLETGFADLVGGKLQLHATDGVTGVVSESKCELAFTGLLAPDADTKRTVILVKHSWASDGGSGSGDEQHRNMSVLLQQGTKAIRWCAAGPTPTGAAGFSLFIDAATGAASAGAYGLTLQPRVEVWEQFTWHKGVELQQTGWVQRYSGAGAALGNIATLRRPSWTTVTAGSDQVTWRVANTVVASAAAPRIDLGSIMIFQQGV